MPKEKFFLFMHALVKIAEVLDGIHQQQFPFAVFVLQDVNAGVVLFKFVVVIQVYVEHAAQESRVAAR